MKCLALVFALSACGGSSGPGKTSSPEPKTSPRGADAGHHSEPPSMDRLSDQQCNELFEHIFDIAIQGQRETLSLEEQPNEADIAKTKTKMRDLLLSDCQKLNRTQLNYDCYMEAGDRIGFADCDCRAKAKSPEALALCKCRARAEGQDQLAACLQQ